MIGFLRFFLKRFRRVLFFLIRIAACKVIEDSFLRWRKTEDPQTSILIISRLDFGTFLIHAHHAAMLGIKGKKISIAVLSVKQKMIENILADTCPTTNRFHPPLKLLLSAIKLFFGEGFIQIEVFERIYKKIISNFPECFSLHCQHSGAHVNTVSSDGLGKKSENQFSPGFLQGVNFCSKIYAIDRNLKEFALYQDSSHSVSLPENCKIQNRLDQIKQKWNIDRPYVVLNINCKMYKFFSSQVESVANIRRIYFPERYNALIDSLIENGYQVIIQGRSEQPFFTPRKNLINLSNAWKSVIWDTALYYGSSFCITCKTGPEVYANLFGKPVLGLNYTEIFSLIPFKKLRYAPKHIYNRKEGRMIPWKEWLFHPIYFNMETNDFSYEELTEEELFEAGREFMLFEKKKSWTEYTEAQTNFRSCVTHHHFDLHKSLGAPCDFYLNLPYQK